MRPVPSLIDVLGGAHREDVKRYSTVQEISSVAVCLHRSSLIPWPVPQNTSNLLSRSLIERRISHIFLIVFAQAMLLQTLAPLPSTLVHAIDEGVLLTQDVETGVGSRAIHA